MDTEDLKKIFADKAFVRELFVLETPAEVQAALKAKGLRLAEADIRTIRDMLMELDRGDITRHQLENGELSEAMLEQIAGGRISLGSAVVGSIVACLVADVARRETAGGW